MATKKQAAEDWPLGKYIKEARGRMAIREASRRANKVSESRWRQVERGAQQMAGDIWVPVHPKAETVADMCRAVSADVRKGLELAGYNPEHYPWLLEDAPSEALPEKVRTEWFDKLPLEEREQVLADLQKRHVNALVKEQTRNVG